MTLSRAVDSAGMGDWQMVRIKKTTHVALAKFKGKLERETGRVLTLGDAIEEAVKRADPEAHQP
jgi:hypothetical protein